MESSLPSSLSLYSPDLDAFSSPASPSSSLDLSEHQLMPRSNASLEVPSNNHMNTEEDRTEEIMYRPYGGEHEIEHVMRLVETELSEPYTIFPTPVVSNDLDDVHRAYAGTEAGQSLNVRNDKSLFILLQAQLGAYSSLNPALPIGIVVCKQEMHRMKRERGYIAMLSVDKQYRKRKIASRLVEIAIEVMTANGSEEIALETEFDNLGALALYSSMGFMKEKRLFRFYLNGKDAHRLILPILNPRRPEPSRPLNMFSTNSFPPPPQHPSRTSQGQDLSPSSSSSRQSSIQHSSRPEEQRDGSGGSWEEGASQDDMILPSSIPASFGIV
ncbi:N-acetyltransferase [Phaffia rhodozyma]|uniref:N-acetyltransferase n=1 Tax=Phaffia rhodozyma TaxID=264483 RepID=A0A0F7SYK9_PHARH|nr:N-acetyltransferase [Phaffia rhodozyma]